LGGQPPRGLLDALARSTERDRSSANQDPPRLNLCEMAQPSARQHSPPGGCFSSPEPAWRDREQLDVLPGSWPRLSQTGVYQYHARGQDEHRRDCPGRRLSSQFVRKSAEWSLNLPAARSGMAITSKA